MTVLCLFCVRFYATHDVLSMLEDEQFVHADVFLDPPGCGLESDEDGNMEDGCNADHFSGSKVSAAAQFHINYGDHIVNSREQNDDGDSRSVSVDETNADRTQQVPRAAT